MFGKSISDSTTPGKSISDILDIDAVLFRCRGTLPTMFSRSGPHDLLSLKSLCFFRFRAVTWLDSMRLTA